MFDLQKVDQGHEIQFSQWHHSIVGLNVNIYKRFRHIFVIALIFRDIKILNLLASKSMSRSPSTIFEVIPFDGKCQNLQMIPTHFSASYLHFKYVKIFICLPSNIGQGRRVQFSYCRNSMVNVKFYKRLPIHFAQALTVSNILKIFILYLEK